MDPEFTVAYAGLAYTLILMGVYDLVPIGEVLPEAKEAISMAFELNSELEEVYLSRALLEIVEENLPGAEKAYLKSFKLNANNADSHHSYSYVLSWLGRHEEAIEEAKKALVLEPINPVMTRGMGYVYYYARQFDMAIAEYKKSIEVDANQLIAYQWLSWAYHSNRMYPEAINAIGEYLKILKREDLATAIQNTFDESGYIQAIRKLIGVSKQYFFPNLSGPYWNSILYASIGEIDEAFHSLERYTEEEYPWRVMNLEIKPYFDSISSDPRSMEISRL
jgi:tetratricopeptide (TPR) repeat protein